MLDSTNTVESVVESILSFWFGSATSGPEGLRELGRRWFSGGAELDQTIRERFGALVEQALDGGLAQWSATARGRLALVILLDQFTRNIYRDNARAYAGDARAQALSLEALDGGLDRELGVLERMFLAMPLLHAEDLALQQRMAAYAALLAHEAPAHLASAIGGQVRQSEKYVAIIERFGRFPHRNVILGRQSTPEERAFLQAR